ncbi:hypothetical protein HYW18_00920 [Candidatus Uhrbacteria bacterium]|nr:hypothetical protein [Candidatus Uhrbacteria bacterium]
MFDLRPLFDLSFWFARKPSALLPTSTWALLISFLVLFLLSVALRIHLRRKRAADRYQKHTRERVIALTQSVGLLGLLWLFFAYEQVTVFQWRWWLLLIFVGALVWAAHIVYEAKRVIPAMRRGRSEELGKLKYLPRAGR